MDGTLAVKVNLDTSAHVVCAGTDGDVLLGDVDTYGETLGIDVRKMFFCLLRIFVSDVQTNVVKAVELHLSVNGAGHNVTRSQ